jgi:hypothetical protein
LANSRGMNAHVWELDEERITMLRATQAGNRHSGFPTPLLTQSGMTNRSCC